MEQVQQAKVPVGLLFLWTNIMLVPRECRIFMEPCSPFQGSMFPGLSSGSRVHRTSGLEA